MNAVDENGCSAAHWACFLDLPDALHALWLRGCDLKMKDNSDMTPLERASSNNATRVLAWAHTHVYEHLGQTASSGMEKVSEGGGWRISLVGTLTTIGTI